MSFVKYRVKEVATDFGKTPKEIADIISKYYEKPKSNTQVLGEAELNALFDDITRNNQIKSIEQVFAVKTAPKAEAPKQEAPKQEAPKAAPAAQQQSRPQQQGQQRPQNQAGRPQQQGSNRPQNNFNNQNTQPTAHRPNEYGLYPSPFGPLALPEKSIGYRLRCVRYQIPDAVILPLHTPDMYEELDKYNHNNDK